MAPLQDVTTRAAGGKLPAMPMGSMPGGRARGAVAPVGASSPSGRPVEPPPRRLIGPAVSLHPCCRPSRAAPRCSAISDGGSQAGSSVSLGESGPPVVDAMCIGKVPLEAHPSEAMEKPAPTTEPDESVDDSWKSWLAYFHDTDVLEDSLQKIREALEEAVAREQYEEAADLKIKLEDIEQKDTVGMVAKALKAAVAEERFSDAARLRDKGLVGLQGWWVARTPDDPSGKIVHIRSEFGRYTGRAFTTRDIAEANGFTDRSLGSSMFGEESPSTSLEESGAPVLEVFLREDANGSLSHWACALRGPQPEENADRSLSLGEVGESVVVESEKDEGGNIVKMSVMFVKDGDGKGQDLQTDPQEVPTSLLLEENEPSPIAASDLNAKLSDLNLDSLTDDDAAEYHMRVPAELRWRDRDHFSVLVAGGESSSKEDGPQMDKLVIGDSALNGVSKLGKGIELQIAGARPTSLGDIISSEANSSTDVLEELIAVLKKMHLAKTGKSLAVDLGQIVSALGNLIGTNDFDVHAVAKVAQLLLTNMGQELSFEGEVMFSRIPIDHAKTDPFCGLYLGAFGPHGPELLLLRRSLWDDGEECIQGVKLTGDLNVPAGEISFRVKVGRKHRLESRGVYPEDLGIIARYQGQGRVAEQGFRDPHWVEGELLQFASGGAPGHKLTGGAQLGFVWAVPGTRRFLILLNRMTLPES